MNGKRRGVVGGVDYVYTGRVRSLNTESIESQLQSGNIVLLTSMAYSLAGGAWPLHMCLHRFDLTNLQRGMRMQRVGDHGHGRD